MQLPLAPTTPDKGASRHLAVRSDSDKYFPTVEAEFPPGFAGIRVMARSLATSPESGSITDVAASIEHVAGDQP